MEQKEEIKSTPGIHFVKHIICCWATQVRVQKLFLYTAMMLLDATKQGRIFMVKYLLNSFGTDVNETDKQGQTALIKACLIGDNMASTRRKLIRLLLSKGASLNNVDVFGRNVLMWACLLGKVDVVKILLGRSLMDLDFNCVDLEGNTALYYVASAGHLALTTMLVESMKRFGVCVDKRNNQGVTPLLVATKKGREKCARVLLDNGASPDIVDPETLMNAKELAEYGNLTSLAELISITNPSTQSRNTFPSDSDDDIVDIVSEINITSPKYRLTRSATSSVQDYVVNASKSNLMPVVPIRNAFSASLAKRKERELVVEEEQGRQRGKSVTEMSLTGREERLLKIEQRNPFLTHNNEFLECRSSTSSETGTTVTKQPKVIRTTRANSTSSKNPYDLREFKNVLSLYGEQKSSTFRIGFSTPVMTAKQFQECLQDISPKKPPEMNSPSFCRSPSTSSTSSVQTSSPSQSRRQSLLLTDVKGRTSSDPSVARRRSVTPNNLKEVKRVLPLVRNLSDPTIQVRLHAGKTTLRRQSLMASTQLQYSSLKR